MCLCRHGGAEAILDDEENQVALGVDVEAGRRCNVKPLEGRRFEVIGVRVVMKEVTWILSTTTDQHNGVLWPGCARLYLSHHKKLSDIEKGKRLIVFCRSAFA